MGVDDDGPLNHIGEGEEVEVRVGLDVVFTACLLPLGECLHGGRHQGNGSMEGGTREWQHRGRHQGNGSIEGGTRGMPAWREAPGEWQHGGRHQGNGSMEGSTRGMAA